MAPFSTHLALQRVEESGPKPFRPKAARRGGFTLLETMVASGIFALVFAGIYVLSSHASKLVRKSDAASDAQRNCLARVDQLRSLGWSKVTAPAQMVSILSTPSGSVTFSREVISVYEASTPLTSPLPSPTPAPTPAPAASPLFTVTKTGTGTPVISPSSFSPATSLAKRQLNYRVLTEWNRFGKTEQRELSTIISKSAAR